MNELTLQPEEQRYWELHSTIKAHGEAAALHMVEFCKALKAMRDERAYACAGYADFADYTEAKFNIKQTQAYSYIQALERLGEKALAENASLGITKLKLLTELPQHMREEFLEAHDAGDLSTRELQEEIDRLKEQVTTQGEQLALYDQAAPPDSDGEEMEELRQDAKRLQVQYDAAVQTEVQKAREAEQKKAEAEKRKEVKAAAENARKQLQRELDAANDERAGLLKRVTEMEQTSKLADDPALMRFGFYFEELQGILEQMEGIIADAEKEKAEKLRAALGKLLTMHLDGMQEG